jgi:hypothetical protein
MKVALTADVRTFGCFLWLQTACFKRRVVHLSNSIKAPFNLRAAILASPVA